jgi:hypothetical protein
VDHGRLVDVRKAVEQVVPTAHEIVEAEHRGGQRRWIQIVRLSVTDKVGKSIDAADLSHGRDTRVDQSGGAFGIVDTALPCRLQRDRLGRGEQSDGFSGPMVDRQPGDGQRTAA